MTRLPPLLLPAPDGFPGLVYCCLHHDGWTTSHVSANVRLLTGFAPGIFKQGLGLAGSNIVHGDDKARICAEIDAALAHGSEVVLTYRIVTADGALKSVADHMTIVRDQHGAALALQGFVKDMTRARVPASRGAAAERFSTIAQATNDITWDWDLESDQVWYGQNAPARFDFPLDDVRSAAECWSALIHPADRERVVASVQRAIASGAHDWSSEYRLKRLDGNYADVFDRGVILRDARQVAVRMVGGFSDFTQHKHFKPHLDRMTRAMHMLSQCNERLMRAADEHGLLNDLCRVVVGAGGYEAAWVSFMVDDTGAREHTAGYCARINAHTPTDISLRAALEGEHSPVAVALRTGVQVVHNDIAGNPAMAHWRDELLARGYRSGIWLPLRHDVLELGVLSIYCGDGASFDAEEVKLLQTLADNIAFGIVTLRSQQERKRIEAATVKIAAGMSSNTGEAFFPQFVRNMASAVGADGAFVAQFKDGALCSANTVTAFLDGAVVPNFAYALAGSPCEQLATSAGCIVFHDVAVRFPASIAARMGMSGYVGCRLDSVAGKPLGLLFVAFRNAVVQPEFVRQTVQIFAARAGAELERRLSDARIHEQASLLDQAKDAIVVHDATNRITFWNKGAERLYGRPAADVLGAPVDEIVYNDACRYQTVRASLVERGEWQGEIVRRLPDGGELVLEVSSTRVPSAFGPSTCVLSIITDITRRKSAEYEVAKLAFHDRLTGLPNRHFLEKQLQAYLDGGREAGAEGALLWIDLDRLKSLNDTRGHDAGDMLLRHTSERIKAAIGANAIPARFGGDEFVVLITGLEHDPGRAVTIAEGLLQSLNEPFELDGHTHSGSASIGLANFRCGRDDAAEILKRADIAMYEAKAAGRNTLRLFDTQMQRDIDLRAGLEHDLRRALQCDELHLAYQPQVTGNGDVTGVEALLRWAHPVQGAISPAQFIPVAETSGLIIPCGAWVLTQACQQLKAWEQDSIAAALTIAVNVSARQIYHPGFVDQVIDIVERTGADPRKLKLELTESCLVVDTEATVEKMKALKAIGISFSLDDFGTGFSSLSYLKRLPLDQLKIDRSFVCDVVQDPNAAVITRSIIALGQSLGLEVIAEGVETEAQWRFLAGHGCGIYQGYLFSRPVGIDALRAYLAQTRISVHAAVANVHTLQHNGAI
jgi:diguanylate cyclase (GGDEF)-like protein/PAS domain S-box-containing protein